MDTTTTKSIEDTTKAVNDNQKEKVSKETSPVMDSKHKKSANSSSGSIAKTEKEAKNIDDGAAMPNNKRNSYRKSNVEPLEVVRRKSLYVGQLSDSVTADILYEMFSKFAPVIYVKIHRTEGSTYAFVQYETPDVARAALFQMDGLLCCGVPMLVRWSGTGRSHSPQEYYNRESEPTCYNVYVGNLDPTVTSAALKRIMLDFGDILDCKVVNVPTPFNHNPIAYGFVYFRHKMDADHAIREVGGIWIGDRMAQFKWAHGNTDERFQYDNQNGFGHGDQQGTWEQQPLNYWNVLERSRGSTSVYVGNLPPIHRRLDTQTKLEQIFSQFGQVLSVKVFPGKLYAFVMYGTSEEAATAIVNKHGILFEGRKMRCYWGKDQNYNDNGTGGTVTPQASDENVGAGYTGYGYSSSEVPQGYDHQSYINAPLLHSQENQFPNTENNPNGYYGYYVNDYQNGNNYANYAPVQAMPYQQPEAAQQMYYAQMPMQQQQQQPLWHQIPVPQGVWAPVEDQTPVCGGGDQDEYEDGYAVDPQNQNYDFWYPDTSSSACPEPVDTYGNVLSEAGDMAFGCYDYEQQPTIEPVKPAVDDSEELDEVQERFESLEIKHVEEEDTVVKVEAEVAADDPIKDEKQDSSCCESPEN